MGVRQPLLPNDDHVPGLFRLTSVSLADWTEMEELQDAIEDAQYVNAIATQDDGPRPVVAWEKPTEDQLKHWMATKKPDLNNMDWVLSHAIGFFLFSHYLKKEKKE